MDVLITLIKGDRVYYAVLPENGEAVFGTGKKDNVYVEGFGKSDVKVRASAGCFEVSSRTLGLSRSRYPLGEFCRPEADRSVSITGYAELGMSEKTLKLPYNCTARVGRSEDNNVIITSQFISRGTHFALTCENGIVHAEDRHSTNGLYLNGRRIQKAVVRSGDVLSVMNIRIYLVNAELRFENVGRLLRIKGLDEESAFRPESGARSGTPEFSRSPRTREQMPAEEIVLDQPPSKPQKYARNLGMFTSLASSGAMIASSVALGSVSPALLAARAASLVSPVSMAAIQGSGGRRRKKELEEYARARSEKYSVYIEGQKARIQAVADSQRRIIIRENPEPSECVRMLGQFRRNLWERRASDNDFLAVRLGNGYEDLCVNVKSHASVNRFEMESDEVKELAEYIIEETRIVDNVPARLRLAENCTVGVIGDRQRTISLVRNMLVALTTAHCYEDVQIVGLFDEKERALWDSLRWLPHIWDENRQMRYLAFDKKQRTRLCDLFHDGLKIRWAGLDGSYSRGTGLPKPYYIFIVGSPECLEGESLLGDLMTNDPRMGVSTLFLYGNLARLPSGCGYIVDVDDNPRPGAYDCAAVDKKILFTPDDPMSAGQFDTFARDMSAVILKDASSRSALPGSLTFLQGYGVTTVDELNAASHWEKDQSGKSLAAPIGVTANGKSFYFDIVRHGPHGLVAGTTGSGKSELLQSWILSVCVLYHPYDVNFVIIDYKGGGMANLLEGLPHVVGKITNIGANIGRSMLSLDSEMERRQRMFAEAGVNKIGDYQAAYRSGRVSEPMPRLIIVSDEFAELKKQEPEFMKSLVKTARIGRSLGVHLVLATQKPGGVVDDQIDSNSNFRICLKVANAADSRDLLKRPDAARLTDPGRAYVRVGEDEIYELIQSYWSGAPYLGAVREDEAGGNQTRLVDMSGARIKTIADEKTRHKSETDELKAVSRYLCRTASQMGIEKLPGPWLPELPDRLWLGELGCAGGFDGEKWTRTSLDWLQIPIGRYDRPELQKQGVQLINPAAEGHYGIYGAPTTGKTSLLKTVVASVCTWYRPDEVNIYILDFGGWNMAGMKAFPHVGDVVLDCEEEKFAKFCEMLSAETERRKRLFFSHTVSSLSAYRASVAKDVPAIIVAVDNIVPLFDLYPNAEETFVKLGRDGASYGIYLIYTANSTSGVRFKLQQNIRGAVAFELTDRSDYAGIVGKLSGSVLTPVTGRAFFKNNPPTEFQAALWADGDNDVQRSSALMDLAARMRSAWTGAGPARVPVMPEKVTGQELCGGYNERTSVPVGMAYDRIEPACLRLGDEYCAMIAGGIGSGKSRLLCLTARMIRERFGASRIYVFDSARGSMSGSAEFADAYVRSSDAAETEKRLAEIVDQLNQRKRAQNKARAEAGDSFSEEEFAAGLDLICVFIDDIRDYVDTVETRSVDSMERIARLAQGLGVMVFAAGRTADLQKYAEIERLTRAVIACQKGVALSDSAAMYGYFKNSLKFGDRDADFGDGNGMLFDGGTGRKIKIMQ